MGRPQKGKTLRENEVEPARTVDPRPRMLTRQVNALDHKIPICRMRCEKNKGRAKVGGRRPIATKFRSMRTAKGHRNTGRWAASQRSERILGPGWLKGCCQGNVSPKEGGGKGKMTELKCEAGNLETGRRNDGEIFPSERKPGVTRKKRKCRTCRSSTIRSGHQQIIMSREGVSGRPS